MYKKRLLFVINSFLTNVTFSQKNDILREWRAVDPDVIDELIQVLAPFKTVTVLMSTEKSSSISLIRPLIHQLMDRLRASSPPENAKVSLTS